MRNQRTKSSGSLHVADLARMAGVTPATVRYYTRTGLIDPAREPSNGYRRFSDSDLHRMVFIRRARALGLTIGDIKAILDTVDRGEEPCALVKSLVGQRLVSIRERITELETKAERIDQALSSWEQTNGHSRADGELWPWSNG